MSKAGFVVCVDDGHPNDLKIAEILVKKKLSGIFYIPIHNADGRKVLNNSEIRNIAKHFEIGSHGLNHQDLTRLTPQKAKEEMLLGKKELEGILGKAVLSFCPPKGKYNQDILNIARQIGIKDVRDAQIVNYCPAKRKQYLWHPNLHLYPHPLYTDLINCLTKKDIFSFRSRLKDYSLSHLELLNRFKKRKSFYLWCHSWEVYEQKLEQYLLDL